MDRNSKEIVLACSLKENESIPTIVNVAFCENSASIQIGKLTVHIPWSELAQWQVWLANRVEEEQ